MKVAITINFNYQLRKMIAVDRRDRGLPAGEFASHAQCLEHIQDALNTEECCLIDRLQEEE
jgi:hypothetical protein